MSEANVITAPGKGLRKRFIGLFWEDTKTEDLKFEKKRAAHSDGTTTTPSGFANIVGRT